jgi:hypothetical protein
MKQEFFEVAMRKKIYSSLEDLQKDLDTWLDYYNKERRILVNFVMAKLLCRYLRIAQNWLLRKITKSCILNIDLLVKI